MAIQIRPFTDNDLPNIAKQLNETYHDTYEFSPYTVDGFHSWLQESRLKIVVAEEDGNFLGTAAYHDGHWGEEIEWLAVSDGPNKKLIENMFVIELEKFVRDMRIFTPIDFDSPKIDEWIERGYKAEGGLYHMIIALDDLKPVLEMPESMVLRSLRPDEGKALVEAVNAGFGWGRLKLGDIQKWKIDSPPFSEDWVQVVVAKPDTSYNEAFGGKRGYLGPASTLAEYRCKNLAFTLTVRALNLLFERGMGSAALFTSETNVASMTLLQKLGFKIGHHWKFMRKNLP
jgi:ribosomal protein S18 acetylase RimI-like enzyme